jgi:hypothetical protein
VHREKTTAEFMLAEYQDLYQNVMHLENKLFSHLSFFTTLFLGIVTASVAVLRLVGDISASLTRLLTVALLSMLFVLFLVVGRFELRMTTELRVRKVKFIEGITEIRRYFVDRDEVIEGYLVLPVGVEKAPPYLRSRCKDWYQILYISLMRGIAALIGWMLWIRVFVSTAIVPASRHVGPKLARVIVPSLWVLGGLLVAALVFWRLSLKSALEFCRRYDEMRVARTGKESEYDLLEPPLPVSRLKWTFGDWMAWLTEPWQEAER